MISVVVATHESERLLVPTLSALVPGVTAGLLGVDDSGTPDPGASPSAEIGNEPGYSDTWFDLERKTMASA